MPLLHGVRRLGRRGVCGARLGVAAPAPARRFATPTETAATPTVLVPVADDSEEIETVCIVDTLVRAGARVTLASVAPKGRLQVTCSRGVKLVADESISACAGRSWDAIVLPGGMPGAERLRDDPTLTALLQAQHERRRLVAAVCASPAVVLAHHGLLRDGEATCYPAPPFQAALPGWRDERVVSQGHLLTSQGPGTSLQFAVAIIAQLFGEEKAEEIADQMLVPR